MRSRIFWIVSFFLLVLGGDTLVICQQQVKTVETHADATARIVDNIKLDLSSPKDAIDLIGKPSKDELDDFGNGGIGVSIKPLLLVNAATQAFRKLTFKKVDGFDSVVLRFYNDKLIQIILDYKLGNKEKRISASSLQQRFNADFVVFEGGVKGSKLSDFEGQKQNSMPRVYQVLYTLLSVRSDRVFFVKVENNNSKAFWRTITGKPTGEMFPGFVRELHIISRGLEKK